MKNENNFTVQMMRVIGDLAPFVKVEYVAQDAEEHSALMLVDSCSCHNVLIGTRVEKHGVVLQKEEGTMKIGGAGNEMVTTSLAKFLFVLGEEQFHESFCIKEGDIQIPLEIDGMPIIGILGNLFMQRYRLAIDYSDYTLHMSNVTPTNLTISSCDFFFPMGIGLQFYNLPVLPVSQDGIELVTLVDTGSTNNMIAEQALNDCGFDYERTAGEDVMQGVIGQIEVKEAMVSFNILSLLDDDFVKLCRKELFSIMPCNVFTPKEGQCDTNGEQLPPIEMLIGSPFMAKERWILDFGAQIIYRRKCSDHLKEAV